MLHPNAKQRLKRVVPEEFDITYRHPKTDQHIEKTVSPEIRWKNDDVPIDYPVVALELSPEAVPRHAFGDEEGDDTYYRYPDHDDEIAYIKYTAKPLYAELHITVAAKQAMGDIPEDSVADLIAGEVYYQFQFNSSHLNTQGTTADGEFVDYEWPMDVYQEGDQGVTNLNSYVDQQHTQRRHLRFRVDYSYWRVEEVEAVDEIEYEIGIDRDYDMEADEWWGPFHVDVGPGSDEDLTDPE